VEEIGGDFSTAVPIVVEQTSEFEHDTSTETVLPMSTESKPNESASVETNDSREFVSADKLSISSPIPVTKGNTTDEEVKYSSVPVNQLSHKAEAMPLFTSGMNQTEKLIASTSLSAPSEISSISKGDTSESSSPPALAESENKELLFKNAESVIPKEPAFKQSSEGSLA